MKDVDGANVVDWEKKIEIWKRYMYMRI